MSERPLPGRKVILRPERLTADFQQINGTLLMTLHWRMSQNPLDQAAVEGFQFTWTLQSDVTMSTERQEDIRTSQTQTIAAVRDNEWFTVTAVNCSSKEKLILRYMRRSWDGESVSNYKTSSHNVTFFNYYTGNSLQ